MTTDLMLAKLKSKYNVDFSKRKEIVRAVPGIMFGGNKGAGKSIQAMLTPGKGLVIAFDVLSFDAREYLISSGKRKKEDLDIIDAMEFYSEEESANRESAYITQKYLEYLLTEEIPKGKYDWILFDPVDFYGYKVAERAMRYKNGYDIYENFSNLNHWKMRNQFMLNVIDAAKKLVNYFVILTGYLADKTEEQESEGEYLVYKEPKFLKVFREQCTYVFIPEKITSTSRSGRKFRVSVFDSKNENIFKVGDLFDVTGYKSVIDLKKFREVYGIKDDREFEDSDVIKISESYGNSKSQNKDDDDFI